MIQLDKITWQEFEKIIHIIKEYSFRAIRKPFMADFWFEKILTLLTNVEKQDSNIQIKDLSKDDLYRLIIIVDMFNVVNNPFDMTDGEADYNYELDLISSKLQKVYFKNFNSHVFLEE